MKHFFKNLVQIRSKQMQHQNNLIVPQTKHYEFGTTGLASYGPKFGILFLLKSVLQNCLNNTKNKKNH